MILGSSPTIRTQQVIDIKKLFDPPYHQFQLMVILAQTQTIWEAIVFTGIFRQQHHFRHFADTGFGGYGMYRTSYFSVI
jgi:hypothetical protein